MDSSSLMVKEYGLVLEICLVMELVELLVVWLCLWVVCFYLWAVLCFCLWVDWTQKLYQIHFQSMEVGLEFGFLNHMMVVGVPYF